MGIRTLDGDELAAYLDGTAAYPFKSVVLTFDVGTAKRPIYADSVIPTLKKYNFKAIFFILSNDTVVIDKCGDAKRFCWDDFNQWADSGIISIASHGRLPSGFHQPHPDGDQVRGRDRAQHTAGKNRPDSGGVCLSL